jgi:hypothetical protein
MRADNDGFKYPSVGPEFIAKTKKVKLKMTPSDNRNDLEYLKALVFLMMIANGQRGAVDNGPLKLTGLLRKVPTLNLQATNAKALQLRKDLEDDVCVQAPQAKYVTSTTLLRDTNPTASATLLVGRATRRDT